MELPPDEFVVVRVLVRRDEAAPPICMDAKSFKVGLAQRREEIQPVVWISEFWDFGLRDIQLRQDFVLSQRRPFIVLRGFLEELF